jgi:putative heme-binding domain-containing protein
MRHAALLIGLLSVPASLTRAQEEDPARRFRVPRGFTVQTAAPPALTGSVVAFTFDPGGNPCVSIEGGPIARLFDDDQDGICDRRQQIAPMMSNCQGLAFIRGALYAVGDGPRGAGLYRLDGMDQRGVYRKAELIRLTDGGMGEHGPHAIGLGPDGKLYYNNGNHAHLRPPIDPASPVNIAYEGELLPHYNDARGHAAGIMAPGGEIYRSDDEGRSWKRIVAGFRNEYDFAFNQDGELFTFDSDMEWDVGLPWYRPVRVNHCTLGAEFGWRNGSGKWPVYNFDSLPAILAVGRGSPTGVTFYHGRQFPAEYFDRLLLCDWSQGRILAVKLDRAGASYRATSDELVAGQPLNCTDIEVGPDGCVYFTTGGRGTQGGLYRVRWGADPTRAAPGRSLNAWEEAIAIGSPLASFSQQRIEERRRQDPAAWARTLPRIAKGAGVARSPRERIRALDLLAQFGPQPVESLLIELAVDRSPQVRARAVTLLGVHSSAAVRAALTQALADPDAFVRRHACESFLQQPAAEIPVVKLIGLLADPDRFIRFAARVALEHADLGAQRGEILAITEPRPLVEGMLALVRAGRLDRSACDDLLTRQIALLRQKPAAELETDVLRLIQLTLLLGPGKPDASSLAALGRLLLERFSTSIDSPANRETARLLAFLDEPRAVAAIVEHQTRTGDHGAQIHDAYCLRAMKRCWTGPAKRQFWAWFETASRWEGGYSFLGYLDDMIQDLLVQLTAQERSELLAQGEKHPFPTRVLVRALVLEQNAGSVPALVALHHRLVAAAAAGPHAEELKEVIVESLGRGVRPDAHMALHEIHALDPPRLDQVARALADHPVEADLPIFVAALASRDANTRNLATAALLKIKASPRGPEGLASLIRLARRVGPASRSPLDELAERWTGAARPAATRGFEDAIAHWERVYLKRFGDAATVQPSEVKGGKAYGLSQLIDNVLRGPVMKTASPQRGEQVLVKARCLECHKLGAQGAGLGPDLTTVSSRFRPSEILESIVLPSKVISDQYRSVAVATSDGKVYSGMPVVTDGPNLVLLLSDGTKVTIPKNEIEERKASASSVMPEGLLNPLSYQEIADLLALLESMPRAAAPDASTGQGR